MKQILRKWLSIKAQESKQDPELFLPMIDTLTQEGFEHLQQSELAKELERRRKEK